MEENVLTRYLKEEYKEIITKYFNIHVSSNNVKDIIILSSPRSGSTWLMSLICSERGMKFVNEPLNKYILDFNKFLPIQTKWNYFTLNHYEERILKKYFLREEPIRHFGPLNLLSRDYNFLTNRRIIKIIRANNLIKWFYNELGFMVIYLIRHPIAQSISCIERNHVPFLKTTVKVDCDLDFIKNSKFYYEYLTDLQRDTLQNIYKNGSLIEKFILEWCLDNMIPLKYLENQDKIILLTYEGLILDPENSLNYITRKYELNNFTRMIEKLNVPSKTADSSGNYTRNKIKDWDPKYLIGKWTSKISKRIIGQLFKIVEMFGIDLYNENSLIPKKFNMSDK